MLIDLHIHSEISPCSNLPLADILELAGQRGLDGVCLTDHQSMAVGQRVTEGVQSDGLLVIIGMEYTTVAGDFLLFGPFEDLSPGLSAAELLPLVAAAGGAAIAAHPCRKARPLDQSLLLQDQCDIIEIYNGRNNAEENLQASRLPYHYPLALTAGSDAHRREELGRFATRFKTQIATRQDLINALQRGDCQPVENPGFQHAEAV